jgi:hypothetical protein
MTCWTTLAIIENCIAKTGGIMSTQAAPTPAGWYPSPENDGRQRYWDGSRWTEHYAPGAPQAQLPRQWSPPPQKSNTTRNVLLVILTVFVLGIGGCMALLAGAANEAGESLDESTSQSDAVPQDEAPAEEWAEPQPPARAERGSQDNPVGVGQTISLEGTKYTVTQAETAEAVGSQFMREQADGVFVVVTLTIENTKNETKTFMDEAAKFVTKDGSSYSTDSDGTFAVLGDGEEPLWLTDMQPDLPKTGKLVFDVPPAKVKGGVLEVSDLFGRGEAYIALGLN